jgi:hypothetical protein
VRNGQEAVQLAEQACRPIAHEDALALDILAAAYAEAGDFAKAQSTAQRALDRLCGSGRDALVASVTARLRLYQSGQAYREYP